MSAEGQSEREALQDLLNSVGPVSASLFVEHDMGERAKEFIASDLGRFMIGAAQQDMQDAHNKLARTLPFRWRRIQSLQNEIRVAEMFVGYLQELVTLGYAAGKSLEERDD